MAIPAVGDGYQVGDGNRDELMIIGAGTRSVRLATSTGKVGFYGTTPISLRTAAIATSAVATASSADVTTALKGAVIDIMNTLAALGLWTAA
jgi:hypothetical protein